MNRTFALWIVVGAALGSVAGCGGGGGGGTTSTPTPIPTATAMPLPQTVVPRVTLVWGERSRAIGELNSALSAVVRLQGAKADSSDLVFTINRDAGINRHSVTVNAPVVARVGQWAFSVTFYAGQDGSGSVVGTAQDTISLGTDGVLPDIKVSAVITQVELPSGQQVLVGQKADLAWAAHAQDGALVPVTPGSGLFSVSDGADRLHITGGQAEGILPGSASVVVRVDGASSTAVPVHVTSNAVVSISPSPAVVSINGSLDFTAQVSETANQGVVWSVPDANGGSITSSGHYTAPGTAGSYSVRATSVYDPDKSATVTVTVQDGSISVGGDFPGSGGIGVQID